MFRSPLSALSIPLLKLGRTSFRLHLLVIFSVMFIGGYHEKMPTWMPAWIGVMVLCVLAHDCIKLWMARRAGLEINEFIFTPIGAIAVYEGPVGANVEIAVNSASLVSLLILFGVVGIVDRFNFQAFRDFYADKTLADAVFYGLAALNLVNIMPVFPCDSGYITRAALSFRHGDRRATSMVSRISQLVAIGFVIASFITFEPVLLIPALFIFVSSMQQSRTATQHSLLKGKRVQDAMQTKFTTVESGTSLGSVADEMIHGSQREFPVVVGEEVIGVLTKFRIVQGLARFGRSAYVAGQMLREYTRIDPEAELEEAVKMLTSSSDAPLLVMEGDSLVGLLSREKLDEYLLVLQAQFFRQRRES